MKIICHARYENGEEVHPAIIEIFGQTFRSNTPVCDMECQDINAAIIRELISKDETILLRALQGYGG